MTSKVIATFTTKDIFTILSNHVRKQYPATKGRFIDAKLSLPKGDLRSLVLEVQETAKGEEENVSERERLQNIVRTQLERCGVPAYKIEDFVLSSSIEQLQEYAAQEEEPK